MTEGYTVANIDYPSRDGVIGVLAPLAVDAGLDRCREQAAERISFVTHSMGGILVRLYLAGHEIREMHRAVMITPPNQGSKVVDVYRHVPGYKLLNGRTVLQLGTDARVYRWRWVLTWG